MVASVVLLNNRVLQALDRDLVDLAVDLASTNKLRQPLFKAAHEVIAPSINKNFVSGGRPAWEQTGTSPYRVKHGITSGSPLWVSGKLKRAATKKARFKVHSNTLTYGYFPSSLWFANKLDQGHIGRTGYPKRQFAMFQGEDKTAIVQIFAEWVEHKVNKNIMYFYR